MKSRWLPWKYQQAVGKGGAVVGLGTDVGSLAICYRKDLFAKAGLPTNRVAVSKLWPTWQAYINIGKRYQAKAPKGTFFFDSGSNVYNAMVGQLNPAYYNAAARRDRGDEPESEGRLRPGDLGRACRRRRRAAPRSATTGTPATRRACSRP